MGTEYELSRKFISPSRTPALFDPLERIEPLRVVSPEAAAALLVPRLAGIDREICVLLALDAKSFLLDVQTVSVGTIGHTYMSPREVFRDALLSNAASILVAHNHPSGDPTPSADDRTVTERLAEAGRTMGIEVVDHIIIGEPGWVSLAREGLL